MSDMKNDYKLAIEASIDAGKAIMEIYSDDDLGVESKSDESPLTKADLKANDIINEYLLKTGIPIISEENKQTDFSKRKNWESCWIVDPLDGTKEFIKRNGEFTVNIAFAEKNSVKFGVIYVPAKETIYYGFDGKSWKQQLSSIDSENFNHNDSQEIAPGKIDGKIRVVGSRSHMNDDTTEFISELKEKYSEEIEVVSRGSSLKFCLVAEGNADVYPRFAPTMEWDTAAGQAICKAVGLSVIDKESGEEMLYNRQNLLNNYFVVSALE